MNLNGNDYPRLTLEDKVGKIVYEARNKSLLKYFPLHYPPDYNFDQYENLKSDDQNVFINIGMAVLNFRGDK